MVGHAWMACTILPVRVLASSLDHDVKVRKVILVYFKETVQQDPFYKKNKKSSYFKCMKNRSVYSFFL